MKRHISFKKIIHVFLYIFLITNTVLVSLVNAATITVDSLADDFTDNGNCTLREAVDSADDDQANDACVTGDGDDTIVFDPSLTSAGSAVIMLTDDFSSINDINGGLTIIGPGAELLTIDGDNNQYDIFNISKNNGSKQYRISGLTLANSPSALRLFTPSAVEIAEASVSIEDMVFDSNTSSTGGAAISISDGNINNQFNLTVKRSTFTNNVSFSGAGISITGPHKVLVEDSTFVNNSTTSSSSAISAGNSLEVIIRRSTFSNNSTESGRGAIGLNAAGNEGYFEVSNTTIFANNCNSDNSGTITVSGLSLFGSNANVVLANNLIAGNFCGSVMGRDLSVNNGLASVTTNGGNFIGTNQLSSTPNFFPVGSPNLNNDFVGDNITMLDPELLPLADNGGPTQTHLPNIDGATGGVIDKGVCPNELLDQRGLGNNITKKRALNMPGISDGVDAQGCDSGAVELGAEEVLPDETFCIPVKAINNAVAVICL